MNIKKGMDSFFEKSISSPKIILAITCILLTGSLLAIPHLQTELRIYDVQEKGFPGAQALKKMREDFNDKNSVILVFSRLDQKSLTTAAYCDIRNWTRSLEGFSPQLMSIFGPFSLRKPSFYDSQLWYPELIQAECPPKLQSGVESDITPPMSALKNTPWSGILTDDYQRDMAIEFNFDDNAQPNQYGRFDPKPIGDLWSKAHTEVLSLHPELTAYLGGRAAFQWHYKELLKKDFKLNLLVCFLLLLLCRIFFGRWIAGIYLGLTLIITATFLFGLMALAGAPIDALSSSLFLMACITTLEDFIFLSHLHQKKPRSWKNNFRELVVPSFFTSLTTIIGFGSLAVSDLGIIRRFGLWGALSAFIEWAVVFFILPAILQVFQADGNWTSEKKSAARNIISNASGYKLPKKGVISAVMILIAAFYGFFHLNFNDSPRDYFSQGHEHRKTYDYLKSTRQWEGSISVVFPSDDKIINQKILAQIKTYRNIAKVDDPYTVEAYLTEDLPQPISELVHRDFSTTSFYQQFHAADGKVRSNLFLKNFGLAAMNETIRFIRNICQKNCSPVGEAVAYAEYAGQVVTTLYKSLILALVLVGIFIVLLCKILQIKSPWKILLSIYWSPIVMIGIIALFQIPMNLITCIFASVFAGLAGDNAIQFLFAAENESVESGTRRRGGGSIQLALISSILSLVFLGFTLLPMKIVGVLLFFGFFIALLGDLWLLNGLTSGSPVSRSHSAFPKENPSSSSPF